ncbi:MAG: hypothetical protein ACTSU5_04015 [Promethearchaeota archaeon]
MEIEKRREITWTLKFSGKNVSMDIRAVEHMGRIEKFGLTIREGDAEIGIDLEEDQFLNFLSILNGFQRGVIGEVEGGVGLASVPEPRAPVEPDDVLTEALATEKPTLSPAPLQPAPQGGSVSAAGQGTPVASAPLPLSPETVPAKEPEKEKNETPELDPREWDPW